MPTTITGTDGVSQVQAGVVGPQSVQVFTSSGTYTKPEGINSIIVEVQAGGGAGRACTGNNSVGGPAIGASGGAGGYARKLIVAPPASVSVTVGSGGVGSGQSGSVGNNGGSSSFGSFCSATGGFGGSDFGSGGGENGAIGGVGGSGSGGDLNVDGGCGETSWSQGSIYSSDNRATVIGGNGGSSVLGTGGRANYIAGDNPESFNASVLPQGYGGGAPGTGATDGTEKNAASGGDGIVIVWEFA